MKTTAQDFVINNLNYLLEKLPYISIKYENDSEGSHFIEIKSFRNNIFDDFIDKFTLNLFVDFVNSFSNENIAFLKEGDLYEIEKVTYSKQGELFELVNKLEITGKNFAFALQPTIQNYNLEFPKKTNISYQDNFNTYNNQYLSSNLLAKSIFASIINKKEVNTDKNYSLAA